LGYCDELLGKRARVADARFARVLALEPPQDGQEVEPPGLRLEFVAELHWTPRSPMRGGQRMISPRSGVRTTVWVKWLIATYSAKKRSRTAPRRNAPEPSKAFSSSRTVTSRPRAAAAPCGCLSRRTIGRMLRLRTPRIFRSVALSATSANRTRVSR